MTKKLHMVGILFAALLTLAGPCLARQADASACSAKYEDHNQIDYGPLKVRAVAGTTAIQVGPPVQGAPIDPGVPGACFILFTESDHKVIASAKSDRDGNFKIPDVAPGRYRLIARSDGLCTANIPIEVVKSSRHESIVVYFRASAIDVCSTGKVAPLSGGKASRKEVFVACIL